MTTNPFFQNFDYRNEQELHNKLLIESIQIYGQDMLYLPRRRQSFDDLYYEDDVSKFDTYYQIEMYVKEFDGFSGQHSFMSTLGLEIRDQLILTVSADRFKTEITEVESDILRPRDGDLIYFPFTNVLFQIAFVTDKPQFFPFGKLPIYDITVETFEYSNEVFETGIDYLDKLTTKYSQNVKDYLTYHANGDPVIDANGNYVTTSDFDDYGDGRDPSVMNKKIETEVDDEDIIDFSEQNPFAGPNGRW